jgi:predicted membrane protein
MRNEARRSRRGKPMSRQGQVILGLMVIGMGLLFLLDNLNIWNFNRALQFWPMVLIIVGVVKLFDTKSANGYFLGAVLILVGVSMILGRMGLIYFSWRAIWPLLLIAAGGAVLYKAVTGHRLTGPSPKDVTDNEDVVDVTAILGGFERRIVTPNFKGGEVTAIMGGCMLDMRGSSIQGEAVLNVFAVFGGINIKCPPDWTVVLHGTPIMGGFEEKTAQPPDNSKRLIVRGYAIMGGVELHN